MAEDIPLSDVTTSTPPEQQENEQNKMLQFSSAEIHLRRIVQDWQEEITDTEQRRKTRKLEIDVEALRQKGEVDEDETLIPIRMIDNNIIQEQPPYINYLKNSRRLGIFDCLEDPALNCDLIEQEFTKVSTYTGWETPYFKCLDGSQAHGWDAVEIIFDKEKPGNFAIEHIGHDKLLFPRSAIDIQKSLRVIRQFDVTLLQLYNWIKEFGFNEEQVNILRNVRKETQKENETCRIYKLFFKLDKVVYVAWFSLENGVRDWLKTPTPLYLGIDSQQENTFVPTPISFYPIVILPYRETEESQITSHKGRVFLDEARQEAMTALWSSFVNGQNRASQVFASPSQEDGSGASLKELEDVVLRGGRILNKPMTFWHMDYPDPSVLKTLQYADVSNDKDSGQVNFAAMNREDSRKTAKEIGAAQEQQSLLNSVQLTLFSTFLRQVLNITWLIVQSQALQNNIRFLLIPQEVQVPNPVDPTQPYIDPATGQPITKTVFVNNKELISKKYSLRAAGDVDVIKRQELEAKMQQDWAVVQNTGLAQAFLTDYIKLRYPDKGDRYAIAMQQGNPLQMQVQQLTNILSATFKQHPEILQQLSPEDQQQLNNIINP